MGFWCIDADESDRLYAAIHVHRDSIAVYIVIDRIKPGLVLLQRLRAAFKPAGLSGHYYTVDPINSRWQGQLGVKFNF